MKLVLSVLLGAAVAPAAAINLNLKGLWQQTELAVADAMRPLSASDRNAVGTALTNALGVLNGDQKPASKLVTCLKLFPNRKQESESNALWESCKEVVTPGTQLNALALSEFYFSFLSTRMASIIAVERIGADACFIWIFTYDLRIYIACELD